MELNNFRQPSNLEDIWSRQGVTKVVDIYRFQEKNGGYRDKFSDNKQGKGLGQYFAFCDLCSLDAWLDNLSCPQLKDAPTIIKEFEQQQVNQHENPPLLLPHFFTHLLQGLNLKHAPDVVRKVIELTKRD